MDIFYPLRETVESDRHMHEWSRIDTQTNYGLWTMYGVLTGIRIFAEHGLKQLITQDTYDYEHCYSVN